MCDEFGDLAGVITPSDILDGLVGAMPQQTVTPGIVRNDDDDSWTVDALIQFYDFLKYFDLENLYHPASYSTLGGLVLEELRHIPLPGEKLTWNGISLEIADMDGARIGHITIRIPQQSGYNE